MGRALEQAFRDAATAKAPQERSQAEKAAARRERRRNSQCRRRAGVLETSELWLPTPVLLLHGEELARPGSTLVS